MACESADVLIIGGGMAGAALGAALAAERPDVSVLLVDTAVGLAGCGDLIQSFVLPHLERWGALEHLCQSNCTRLDRCEVWHSLAGRLLVTPYSALQVDGYPHALAVQRPQLAQALLGAACSYAGLRLLPVTRYAGIRAHDADGLLVELHQGQETRLVRTSWLIAADGPDSAVRRDAGIAVEVLPYDYDMLIAKAEQPPTLAGAAAHFFGPWGFAGLMDLPGGWSNLGVSVPRERVGAYLALSDAERDADVRRRAPVLAGSRIDWSEARLFRMHRHHAAQYARGRVVLLGAATRLATPLLGMTIALDIEDAAALAPLLAHRQRLSAMSPARLHAAYRSQRRARNAAILQKSDVLGAWQVGTHSWVHTAMLLWLRLLRHRPQLLHRGILRTYGLSQALSATTATAQVAPAGETLVGGEQLPLQGPSGKG